MLYGYGVQPITRKIETPYSVACCFNMSENMLQLYIYKLYHGRNTILIGNSSRLTEWRQCWSQTWVKAAMNLVS
jgi:hypothetical protein